MRDLKEIKEDTRIIQLDDIGSGLHGGYLRLRTGKQRTFSVVVSVADGRWEHVSVSIYNSVRTNFLWIFRNNFYSCLYSCTNCNKLVDDIFFNSTC